MPLRSKRWGWMFLPQHLANTLRAGGLNLPEGVLYTTESLAQAIATLYRAKA